MPEVETTFRCLRCSHEHVGMYDADEPQERACPECGSNSVRPLPTSRGPAKKTSAGQEKTEAGQGRTPREPEMEEEGAPAGRTEETQEGASP